MFDRLRERRFMISEIEQRMPLVAKQLAEYFKAQFGLYENRGVDIEKMQPWVRAFTEKFFLIRADRADDLQKPGVQFAQNAAREFFGENNHNFDVDCMDGRNMPAVKTSHPPHEGGIMRTAGGEFEKFRDGTTPGTVVIDSDSFKAQAVKRILLDKAGGTVYYSFDSHFGCAARAGSESVAGSIAQDNGLAADIRRKITLARGVIQIHDELEAQGENVADIYPGFYSYDPHDGTMTMGLEMHVNSISEEGFTQDVINKLAKEGKIVQTWQLLHDSEVVTQLEQIVNPVDFRNKFSESMGSNWEAILELYKNGKGIVYRKIYRLIKQAYEKSGWTVGRNFNLDNHEITLGVIENKSKLMLKNLVTRWSIAQNEHEWPYDKHQEQVIVFTEGGYPPFREIDAFSIFSRGTIVNHAYLALGLIRDFRRKGSIVDPIGLLKGNEFVEAPIVMVNKGILRTMSDSGWKALEKIDPSQIIGAIDWDNADVLKTWDKSHISELILNGLEKNSQIMLTPRDFGTFVDGVYEVFDRVRVLMSDSRFRPMLINGNVIMINILVDKDRRTKTVLPFVV